MINNEKTPFQWFQGLQRAPETSKVPGAPLALAIPAVSVTLEVPATNVLEHS